MAFASRSGRTASVLWVWLGVCGATAAHDDAAVVRAHRVGRLLTCVEGAGVTVDGLIVTCGSRIVSAGPYEATLVPAGVGVEHHPDAFCIPGFVDGHAHVGGLSRRDYNEMAHPANPELRTLDMIEFEANPLLRRALAGGVTTVLFIPGSGTNLSGFGSVIKTAARNLEEGVVRERGALKIAHAFNPRRNTEVGATMMGLTWNIREALLIGRDYDKARAGLTPDQSPETFRPDLEPLRDIVRRDVPIAVHTQYFGVVHASVALLNAELKLDAFVDHGTRGAFPNAPLLEAHDVPVINGPNQLWYDQKTGRVHGCASEWHARGLRRLGINTDSPVIPQHELNYQAAMACRLGLPTEVAIRGLTAVPAEILGVEARVGTLEPGKDADFVLWSGNPIDPRSRPMRVFVNGRSEYREGNDAQSP